MALLEPYGETAGIIREVEDACARRAEESSAARRYIGMSSIGDACERRVWLRWRGAERLPLEGRLARIFANGHAVEERVVADLESAGYAISGRQLEFEDFGGAFRGHCDGVIEGVTARPHILEIKSANDASFKRFQSRGAAANPAYAGQLQCYMGYSGLDRALFVVENKNTQELYMERARFDRAAFEALRARAWRIIHAAGAPAGMEPAGCWRCEYRETCRAL